MENGQAVDIYQIGHEMAVGHHTAKERVMSKSNGGNGADGPVEVRLNGITLCIHAPIPTRPKVLRITTDDGRQVVLGDYGTFEPHEIERLHTIVEPEGRYWKHFLEDNEKALLAEAEHDLDTARHLVTQTGHKLDQARLKHHNHLVSVNAYTAFGSGNLSDDAEADAQARRAQALERAIDVVEEEFSEARSLEQHALSARNETRRNLARAAQRRMPDQPIFKAKKTSDATNWRDKLRQVVR